MPEVNDHELLAQFARENSEAAETAFAALVGRHVNLVYSVALRHTGNPHAAEEITQAVFIILARKAKNLSAKTILPGWLHQTARLTAANYLRGEIRRQKHEQEAFMQTILTESANEDAWRQLAPHLDEAISKLRSKDRDALILRYFENKNLREVGAALGVEERAAQKRVNRAVEKLRHHFSKRGIGLTTAIIAGVISANSVSAAPVGLATAITTTVLKGSTVAATTLTLVKGTMKTMTWMKIKFAIGVGVIALLAGGAGTMAISQTMSSDKLSAQKIFQKTEDTYAALSSYSDSGVIVENVGNRTFKTTFNLRLQRPNLYRVDWSQAVTPTFSNTGVVWSAGNGDFVQLVKQAKPEKSQNMEMALAAATGVSGTASSIIPGIFFKLKLDKILNPTDTTLQKQGDENVNSVDCYVVSSTADQGKAVKKTTTTLWIGKQDFLIHQSKIIIEGVQITPSQISDAAIKQMLENQNKPITPEAIAATRKTMETGMKTAQTMIGSAPVIFTQTHENISVNQQFSPSDFAP